MTTRETQARVAELEATVRMLARGVIRALSGQARFTEQDFERLRELIGDA